MINTKRRLFLLAGLLVIVVGFVVWQSINSSKYSSSIRIEVAPTKGSKILINGKGIREGITKVSPGKYLIEFSHPGFNSESREVHVGEKENYYVGAALQSISDKTVNWYSDNPDDAKKAEGISSGNFDQLNKNRLKKLPLIEQLPLIDLNYRIDHGRSLQKPEDPEAVAVYVTYYSEQGKTEADEWLRFKGYDPTKSETIYKNANE